MLPSVVLRVALLALQSVLVSANKPASFIKDFDKRGEPLQDIVKWDEHSLFVNGERAFIFSGEVHPWRMPVPSLWIDIFQKIKALGFNTVSFYVAWHLVEGKPGDFRAEGIFAYEPFFEAASKAGIWLIARPGPYINAETSGGGFPGWLQRLQGRLRTPAPDYLKATENYVASIGAIIAKAQITNGGPVILYQPENEYSGAQGPGSTPFPNGPYFDFMEKQARKAGIVVPLMNNDAWSNGIWAPTSGLGNIDIYGYDNYPLGNGCATPNVWPAGGLRTDLWATHMNQSPKTPHSIPEFQGGIHQGWGGVTSDMCAALINHEAIRVTYKNNYASGVSILNLYMTFGGTNWGNLGDSGGHTTYDYAAVLAEDRTIAREKYSELKLQAQFLKSSLGYLTAVPAPLSTSRYTENTALAVTPVLGTVSNSSFYVVRHSAYDSTLKQTYSLKVTTSKGPLILPQLGGNLTLSGRDSKIHVTDYDISGTTLLYSTAEVFTWKKFESGKVLIIYGGPGELHEAAIITTATPKVIEGEDDLTTKTVNGALVFQWETSSKRRIVQIGDLSVYILDRNSAYNYWVPDLDDKSAVIVKAGYLIRTAQQTGNTLYLTADFNATTSIEVIGASKAGKYLKVNGRSLPVSISSRGIWTATVQYNAPMLSLPDLATLPWKSFDALPELENSYSDAKWVSADLKASTNPKRNQTTPTSLFASDYGFHSGALLYRGHFVATGDESTILLFTQGGNAYATAGWLNGTSLGGYASGGGSHNTTYQLGKLEKGEPYVLTVVVDRMGYDENWWVGLDDMKQPHGILGYTFAGRSASDITWKIQGNLGGEDYADKVRGPLNEGGLYPERQGWHQRDPPTAGLQRAKWGDVSPLTGTKKAGIMLYTTKFELKMPNEWDIPLYFNFPAIQKVPTNSFRIQLYVNGYQFGKYVANIGPQVRFPVPQGVLNYRGTNTLTMTVWATQPTGAKLSSFSLTAGTPVMSALKDLALNPMPRYSLRPNAY